MKRRSTITVAVVVAAAAVVVVAGGAAWWLLTRTESPDAAAQRYLTALADGDYDTVSAMRAQPLAASADATIEAAFRGAASYITEPHVDGISASDGGTRTVTATARFDGTEHEFVFVLGSDDGRWKLSADYLGSILVQPGPAGPALDTVLIGGAPAPAGTAVPLLPAVYDIAPAPAQLLTGQARAAAVPSYETTGPAQVELSVGLAPGAAASAQPKLDDYARACTAPATSVPADCGLRVPWAADLAVLDSIDFRVDRLPALSLSADGRSFEATGGVVEATARGTTRTGEAGAFTYRADDWALRGTVSFAGGALTLAVR